MKVWRGRVSTLPDGCEQKPAENAARHRQGSRVARPLRGRCECGSGCHGSVRDRRWSAPEAHCGRAHGWRAIVLVLAAREPVSEATLRALGCGALVLARSKVRSDSRQRHRTPLDVPCSSNSAREPRCSRSSTIGSARRLDQTRGRLVATWVRSHWRRRAPTESLP
jgi:hypothetical protein